MFRKLLHSVWIVSVAFCFITATAQAQNGTIRGHITDQTTGQALISANVYIASLQRGAATDLEGNFIIEGIPYSTYQLRISYIGYQTKTISITVDEEVEDVEISLQPSVGQLDELVVTGLASSIKRKNLANAVASVSAEELTGATSPETVTSALQGKIAGIQITSYSGAPGGGFNIQLRGISTLGAGSSQPLIILDGIPISNATFSTGRSTVIGATSLGEDNVANMLSTLNPENIASVEVLKGPSAAAIYGQRANAGVIIITTKSGSPGETRVSFSQDIGFVKASKFLGRTKWTEARIKAYYDGEREALELQRYRTAKQNGGIRDLEKVFYGNTGLINNTQLSISGGNDVTRFYVSGNIEREEGIIEETGFKRRSLRANLEHELMDNILISSHSSYTHAEYERGFTGNQNTTGGSLGYTLSYTPNYAYGMLQQNPDGTYPDNPYFGENPFRLIDLAVNNQDVDRFLQSINVQVDLYEQGATRLALDLQGGLDYITANSIVYFPNRMQVEKASPLPGTVIHSTQESLNANYQAVLSFNTNVKGNFGLLYLGTQVGATRFDHKTSLDRLIGNGLLPGQTNVQNASTVTPAQFFTDVTDIGFFAQQTINWDDKIIATVGARYDRSTLNLQQDEYYFYPKASLAVNITNFEFWTVDLVDQFKLRAAYGETGGLPTFGTTFSTLGNTNIGGSVGTFAPTTGVDPDLVPERAKELEYGIDFSLFNGRLSFSGTRYNKTVSDLILGLAPAPSTGLNNVLTNAADLENKGIELSISVIPVQSNDFYWYAKVMWWKNDTKITHLKIPPFNNGLFFGATRIEEGVSPTAIFGSVPGVEGFVKLGNFSPDYQMSWSNQFTFFGNLNVSFLWDLSQGAEVINLSKLLSDLTGNSYDYWAPGKAELSKVFKKRQSLGFATVRFVEHASFIKLRELSISYNLPNEWLNQNLNGLVRGITVGVSGTNLLTITDYSGYNPEVNATGRTILGISESITPYPASRRIMFHLNLKF